MACRLHYGLGMADSPTTMREILFFWQRVETGLLFCASTSNGKNEGDQYTGYKTLSRSRSFGCFGAFNIEFIYQICQIRYTNMISQELDV